jgi:hypothetical protein
MITVEINMVPSSNEDGLTFRIDKADGLSEEQFNKEMDTVTNSKAMDLCHCRYRP